MFAGSQLKQELDLIFAFHEEVSSEKFTGTILSYLHVTPSFSSERVMLRGVTVQDGSGAGY